jgi:nitrate/TMAO reductase-like tetraheme cytochrome c subunit
MKKRKRISLLIALCVFVLGLLLINGCAPTERQEPTGQDEDELSVVAVAIEWSPESDCAMCHSVEDLSKTDVTTTAGMHDPSLISEKVDCMSCHSDASGLANAHEGAVIGDKAPTRLRATKVTSENCTVSGCHDDEAARKESTAAVTTLTDMNNTTVNPHDLPTGEGHSSITCSSCHKGHAVSEPDKFCVTCHHERIYECGTCHE